MEKSTSIKRGFLFSLFASLIIFWPSFSFATSGCCSHHGGVCGCNTSTGSQSCCDGTDSPSCGCAYTPPTNKTQSLPSLSSLTKTCNYSDLTSLESKLDSTKNDLQICIKSSSAKETTINNLKKTIDNRDVWLWIFGIALVGYVIAFYNKKSH
jgi:hypothetical protein